MSESAEILFANEAFYHHFRNCDLAGMESLWAQHHPVACLHPGWPALTDREEVLASWQGIFANGETPQILCRGAQAFRSEDHAFVICYEFLHDTLLVATNIFVREDGEWKLQHHQAGPCNMPPEELREEPETGSLQ